MPVIDAARSLIDLVLSLVDVAKAKELLDEAAVRRANLAADIAERIKFGSVSPK